MGLQVGDPDAAVRRAAVAHELTPAVVDRLIADPVDLVVAYHPLLFRPTTSFVAGGGASGRAYRLAAAGIGVAVAHTNFDVAPGGAADALADALGLEEIEGFGPLWGRESVRIVAFVPDEAADSVADAMAASGAGTVGAYTGCSFRSTGTGVFTAAPHSDPAAGRAGATHREPETRVEMSAPAARADAVVAALVAAHPYEEPVYDVLDRRGDAGFVGRVGSAGAGSTVEDLAALVSDRLGGVVRVAGTGAVRRVAVVPGSGADFADAARSAGADVIVTGDVRHHAAAAAIERGLAVVDPGHAPTEGPGVERLYAAVAAEVPETRDLTESPDPWRPA